MVRLQNIILLFVLILVTTSANAQNAGDKIQISDFWYKIIDDENKKVELCDTVEGASFGGNISIPSTVQYNEQSYNVTKIGADAFKKGYYSKFSIPSSISEIGANAFAGCVIDSVKYASTDHMQEIDYGTGTSNPMAISKKVFVEGQEHELQNIELTICQDVKPRVFKGAKWLTGVTIGSGVTSIGDDAFYGTMIGSITLPSTLTSMGTGVFKNCSNLQTVIIENHSEPLALTDQMFLGCNSLTSVTLNNTKSTGKSTFYGCSSLTSLPQGLETIGESAFGKCTGLITLEIPATIKSIDTKAFEGCNKIEDIIIAERGGNNTLSIGSEAFKDLSRLKYIYSRANPAPTALSNAFNGGVAEKSNIKLYYPSEAPGYNAVPWTSFSQKVFGEPYFTLTYIWGTGGNESGTQGEIVVGSKIIDNIPGDKRIPTKNGWNFVGWKDSEGNDITANSGMPPQDLTIYAYFQNEYADTHYKYDLLYSPHISTAKIKGFADNYAPGEITLTQKVTINAVDYPIVAIEADAFKGNQSLVSVDLSGATNLTSIGNGVFEGCTYLESVTFAGNTQLTTIPNRFFYGCSKLASFTLPSTIETIGIDAFNQCSSLTNLSWGEKKLQTIKANAFKYCNNLTTITLPSTFQRIEDNAFFGCSNIRMITINSQVPEVDGTPFSFQNFKDVYLYVNPEWKDAYNAEDCYWNLFTINPTAKTLTYIIDGNQEQPYDQIESVIPGTKISPHASPVEPFKGWYGEPEIMPNEDVVVNGWLQHKVTYMAEGTNDKLINEPYDYFTGDEITTPDNLLKKNGLTYVIVNPIATMPAQDVTIYVKYSLNNAPTGKSNIIYNGNNQSLLNESSSPTGTLKYSLDNVNFSTTIPQGKDVKTYVVYYRVEGITPNYKTESKSLSVAIAPREITTFSISPTSYIYDGSEKKPAVTVTYTNTTVPSNEYTVSYTNNINVGTATVTLSDKNGGNYNIHGSKTFTINKADGSWKQKPAASDNLTYNSTPQKLIKEGTGTSETGTIQYRLSKEEEYQATIPTRTDAGEHTVYYKVIGDANHKDINESSLKVTINEKPIEIPADAIVLGEDFDYSYDGKEKKPTVVSVKYGDLSFTDADYTVSYSNNKNVGTEAKVILTDKKGGNYIVSGTKTFTILPERSKLTKLPTAKNNIYNGSDQDLINKDGTAVYGIMQYSLSQDKSSFSETVPKGKNAGSYIVYCKVKGDANHSDSEISSVNVTIAPKEITTFALSASSFAYDGTEKKPAVTVTYNNTTVSSSEYTVSYTNNKNAGTATVTLTDKEGGNFKINGSKTFTITKAEGSLKQNPSGIANLSYNGKAQNLITAGSSETGTVEYSLDKTNYGTTIPTGTDAKSYTVYYRVKGDANHKDANGGSVNVTIAKAPLTITAENQEIFEGEAIPEFSIRYDGFMNNETQTVLTNNPTVSCRANATSKAGEYTITVGGAKADNYNITHKNGKLVILALKFVSGGDTTRDENDAATYQITSIGNDKGATPTVSITDDKEVGGAFAIPETVTYHNKTFTVTEISESAFENNKYLTEVTIPSSITNIGDKAFKGCSNLKSITVYITTPISLAVAGTRGGTTRVVSTSVFDGVDKTTCILYVPEASVNLYKTAPVWKEFQHILPLSSNPTGISGVTKTEDEPFDIYNLQGQKVKSKATDLNGLPKGIYIINGKKYAVK